MIEKYKTIKDYPMYKVSSYGNIFSLYRNKILSPRKHKKYNYIWVSILLTKNKIAKEKQISRLVAEAFLRNPKNKKEVNHKDNDATNNNLKNLEWMTHSENVEYAKKQKRCGRKRKFSTVLS